MLAKLTDIHNDLIIFQKKLEPWIVITISMSIVCFLWQIIFNVDKLEKLLWLEAANINCVIAAFIFGVWVGAGMIRVGLKRAIEKL